MIDKGLETETDVLEHIKLRGFNPDNFEIYFNNLGPVGSRYRGHEAYTYVKGGGKFSITSAKNYFEEGVLDHELGHAKFIEKHPIAEKALCYGRFPYRVTYVAGGLLAGTIGAYAGRTAYALSAVFGLPFPYTFIAFLPVLFGDLGEWFADAYVKDVKKKGGGETNPHQKNPNIKQ